jgi:hypothetical protein
MAETFLFIILFYFLRYGQKDEFKKSSQQKFQSIKQNNKNGDSHFFFNFYRNLL